MESQRSTSNRVTLRFKRWTWPLGTVPAGLVPSVLPLPLYSAVPPDSSDIPSRNGISADLPIRDAIMKLKCLFCENPVPVVHSLVHRGVPFCCNGHRKVYHAETQRLMLARLSETQKRYSDRPHLPYRPKPSPVPHLVTEEKGFVIYAASGFCAFASSRN